MTESGSNNSADTTITFVVVGRNEAPTLTGALKLAQQAASAGDHVLFADSASTDGSEAIAKATGVETVSAPAGKGRAMARAWEQVRTSYICFIDADIFGCSHNIPSRLATAVRHQKPAMVVGEFGETEPGVLSNTVGVYEPLVAALFPEAAGRYGAKPLTGFRALRADLPVRPLPGDFGVEAHLNLSVALLPGATTMTTDIGNYEGRFLYKPTMGREIGRAVLDYAERLGRLDSLLRPQWNAWVETVVEHVASFRGEPHLRERFRQRLLELAQRPLPPARAQAAASA